MRPFSSGLFLSWRWSITFGAKAVKLNNLLFPQFQLNEQGEVRKKKIMRWNRHFKSWVNERLLSNATVFFTTVEMTDEFVDSLYLHKHVLKYTLHTGCMDPYRLILPSIAHICPRRAFYCPKHFTSCVTSVGSPPSSSPQEVFTEIHSTWFRLLDYQLAALLP